MANVDDTDDQLRRFIDAHFNDDNDDNDIDFEGFNADDVNSDIELPVLSDSSDSEEESGDDDPPPQPDRNWTSNFSPILLDDFTEVPGPNLPADFDVATARAIDYFDLLFKPHMYADIARHTNNYARWKMDQSGENDPRWSETSDSEIRAFIGINILMGITQLPSAEMYWSQDAYLGNAGIQKIMPANRYQKLVQYFHVSDRATEPAPGAQDYDKLYKVRPVTDHTTETFQGCYTLSQQVAVDEAMIRYAGHHSMKQYMPAKPIKRGLKVWMLCDSNSAYLSKYSVYLGKQNNQTEHGLGYNVVNKMTQEIRNSNRQVYFDNYFTSVALVEKLLDEGLYSCGTVRVNRKEYPKELQKPRDIPNRGDYKILQRGDSFVTASVWRDKKLVHHVSSLSDPEEDLPAQHRVGRNVLNLRQPHSVYAYNKYMGGVDQHDQHRMCYDVGRNSKKWWLYLFWFIVNCAVVNAFIMYNQKSTRRTTQKRYSHLNFRMELVKDLIHRFTKRKRDSVPGRVLGQVSVENVAGHVHGRLPGKRRRCVYHTKVKKERVETVYGCTQCQVPLCKDGCHALFHNRNEPL